MTLNRQLGRMSWAAIIFTFLPDLLSGVHAHATLADPPPRGALAGSKFAKNIAPIDTTAPYDYKLTYPAGDKGMDNAGTRSQMKECGAWRPFEPLEKNYKWCSGVCGDLKGKNQQHRRGGRFYFDGLVTRTYIAGTDVDFQVSVVGHHLGFFEFHICEVSKCDGEISGDCFKSGKCKSLQRTRTSSCEGRKSKNCGPIDNKYKGRWYLPCPFNKNGNGVADVYGGKDYMRYKLPGSFSCEHCVLQWFYTTANVCNPTGLNEYFESDRAPLGWGACKTRDAKIGGYSPNRTRCGGTEKFSQQYFSCADVRIVFKNAPPKDPFVSLDVGYLKGGKFSGIAQVVKKKSVSVTGYTRIMFHFRVKWAVPKMIFYLKQREKTVEVGSAKNGPYYLFGFEKDGKPRYWKKPVFNEWIEVSARAGGFTRKGMVFLSTTD